MVPGDQVPVRVLLRTFGRLPTRREDSIDEIEVTFERPHRDGLCALAADDAIVDDGARLIADTPWIPVAYRHVVVGELQVHILTRVEGRPMVVEHPLAVDP